MDPTRLFPGFAHERILEVEPHGTTLHIATDEKIDDDDAPQLHVMKRACPRHVAAASKWRADHDKATIDAKDLRALNSHMVQAGEAREPRSDRGGRRSRAEQPAHVDRRVHRLARCARSDRKAIPTASERLRRIGESAGRILRFTRDLVAYARPSSEVPVPVSLHNVIDQALAFCEHVLAEHSAKVERQFDLEIPGRSWACPSSSCRSS